MPDPLPVLWLCGPAGVGKSTAAWELFAGMPGAGHVDIDQIGMCFPEIPADPGRTVLEARILGRVVANFRAAGASCLIVSGYIDSHRGIHTEHLPHAALTVLRLRCDQPELRRRLEFRANPAEDREAALREAIVLDRTGLPYPCLDTTARTPAEVLDIVRDRWGRHTGRPAGPWPDPVSAPGEILWICGPAAVGKSTVGWEVAQLSRQAGHTTGFVDLQQIGFLHSGPDHHRLQAANLVAVWINFHGYGAQRLVVVGAVDQPSQVRRYTEALAPAKVTLCRLHASPERLGDRIRRRGRGEGPPIAGDVLRGQPERVLKKAHAAAVTEAEALEGAGLGDMRVDTDDHSAAELARLIGWPPVSLSS
ncbi:AAA family ATPase [Actinoplanes palleronii]|uniref:AAA family ATPase n=1 Tax=Actinoplanes palleronii TaxID=113570 RepID=UPI0019448484|nr:AAA family ATPase [Actinoplanes palleronii]